MKSEMGVLRERVVDHEVIDRERELSLLRSGSAPPTVEQPLGAVFFGGCDVSEEEFRSDPAYISYYYQNVKLNPRLPPPLPARQDLWATRRLQGSGGGLAIGDRRIMNRRGDGGRESLFLTQPDFGVAKEELKMEETRNKEWSSDGLIGLPGLELRDQRKSIADVVQDGIGNATSISRYPVRPASCAYEDAEYSGSQLQPDLTGSAGLVAALSGLSLDSVVDEGRHSHQGQDDIDTRHNLLHSQRNQNPINQYPYLNKNLKGPSPPIPINGGSSPSQYLNIASPTSSLSNYWLDGCPASSSTLGNHNSGNGLPMTHVDSYLQYLSANAARNDLIRNRGSLESSYIEFLGLQNAYFKALIQNSHYGLSSRKPCNLSNGFFGNSGFGLGSPYTENPMAPSIFPDPPILPGGPFGHAEQFMHNPLCLRNVAGNIMGPWPSEPGTNLVQHFASLLDEFKGNKTRCFELGEIAGHVIEFSVDQYGSRFIQQKLETGSTEEKDMVFHEIMPQALSLMTDVFGNYVIQKFLEQGNASQIRQLAEQLTGHVLTLSLEMYGCRVIQKAIEVMALDQQVRMVAELDGHVMHCVRDQNGNHVIQKCIECVPEAAIRFILIKFYNQVVALSTHPYGCRVIQRVLEHCRNPTTQSLMMNEILQSVCMLSQDQFGNYVIQHVLEHGKPRERSAIINQLIGKTVQMSQQKYSSNVIEKCLSFGTPEERQILVDEMLGANNEHEPLQVMMKDQFANYVVQKVLETCDDRQLELILDRLKIHLNDLKKYTYGKHIVARVEKLVATGERRIRIMSSYST